MSSKSKSRKPTSEAEGPETSVSERPTFEEVVEASAVVIKTMDPRSVGVPAGGIVFGAEPRRFDAAHLLSLGESALRFIVSHPDLSISLGE
jgi:hypothetical protein